VSKNTSLLFWMPEPIFMKLDSITWHRSPFQRHTFFMNSSHRSVCVCVSLLSLLGNGSVKTLPWPWTHMQRQNCLTRRFLRGPSSIKRKYATSSSRIFLSFMVFTNRFPSLAKSRSPPIFCIHFWGTLYNLDPNSVIK
jgi:hypothetical protein